MCVLKDVENFSVSQELEPILTIHSLYIYQIPTVHQALFYICGIYQWIKQKESPLKVLIYLEK